MEIQDSLVSLANKFSSPSYVVEKKHITLELASNWKQKELYWG